MNDPEMYKKNNGMQRHDVKMCLREFGDRIRWKGWDRVADLGCGDGGTTANMLRRFLPDDFSQLVGVDASTRMVEHAETHHADARTSFRQLDLAGPLPDDLVAAFDHAFSFYVLHWIRDKERAFRNIYELLTEGGDCLVMFRARMPMLDVYYAQATLPDWSVLMKDLPLIFADYHKLQEPAKEVKQIMEKIGFKNIIVEHKEMQFVFQSLDEYRNVLLSISPFNIPEELKPEYVHTHVKLLRDLRIPTLRVDCAGAAGDDDLGKVHMEYSLLIASGVKASTHDLV